MRQLDSLITMCYVAAFMFVAFYYGLRIREDLKIPKYYNVECIVISDGYYRPVNNFVVPESFVIVQCLQDTNMITTINSINLSGFIDFKYKIGDTLHFDFIRKDRFRKK